MSSIPADPTGNNITKNLSYMQRSSDRESKKTACGNSDELVSGSNTFDDTYWRMYVNLVGNEEACRVESEYQARLKEKKTRLNESPVTTRRRCMQLSEILN
jgi:hypothetical protein